MGKKLNMIYVIGHPGHEKMGKGVTLSNDELKALKELLNSMDL